MNYYELKENVAGLGEVINKLENQIEEKASSTDASAETIETIKALKQKKSNMQVKYDTMKERLDKEKKHFEMQSTLKPVDSIADKTPEKIRQNAFAKLIRNTMSQKAIGRDVYEALGDDAMKDDDTTGGSKFLPKTVSTSIIAPPEETNPLRGLSQITQIPNLEIPRITFTLDDDSFVEDGETAKEIKAKGDTVSFERHKFKVQVGMSETVLLGSNAALTQYVENGLRNGVTVKERSVAFNPAPAKEGEKHMSFYDPSNNIKKVSGADLYEAIVNAVADLHEAYREKATIVMSYSDYMKIIKTLSNGSSTLYAAQPEQILGKPVVFTDAAVKPVVGDFEYSQYNYDISTLFDQQKDIHTGINYFVVTAWMDHQIKLSSAFRIAEVGSDTQGK